MRQRSFLYEIPFFYFILFVLQRSLFPDYPSFYRMEPHPYWLGVILFAMRYGLAAGAFSGLLSMGLYLGGIWFEGERYLFEDADFYLLPGLFLALGCGLGNAVDRLLYLLKERANQISELENRNRQMIREVWIQRQAGRAMEQQIVSQMSSLVTLYAGARNLGSLDRSALMEGILDFFCQALKASQAAIHLKEGDRWVLHNQRGLDHSTNCPKNLGFTQGLIGKAGSENRVVSLRDWFSELDKAWENRQNVDAVLAGPLRQAPGQVFGVFSVQDLPFLRFNSASLNLLTLLLDWAEEAIAKSFYFEELKSKSILDEIYNVYNAQYFQNRSQQEFSRSKTYALPFSILLVSVENLNSLPPAQQVNYLRALSRLLLETSRKIDIVTKFPEPGIPFAVLMMTATRERAGELRSAIAAAHKKLAFYQAPSAQAALHLHIGIGSYAPAMESVEAMLDQARHDFAAV